MLIAAGAAIAIYFWIQTARVLWVNYFLNGRAQALVSRWEVEEESSNRYVLTASYSFEANGQTFHGFTRFERPAFLNSDSAIAAVREAVAAPKPLPVWFDASNPDRSSLEKKPVGSLLFRAVLSLGVLIHFVMLRKKDCSQRSSAAV